jgi:2-polyprenyl-3-methyl-5-hydroxy-6-metoxy-1,4-benzoquinol methylase
VKLLKTHYYYDGKNYSHEELKKIFESEINEYNKNIDERIEKTLSLVEGEKILDVGCAGGGLSKMLADMGFTVYAVDILEESIDVAKEFANSPKITYETRDVIKQPFLEESFDGIVFLETIEHVENPAQFFKEFHRILKTNGNLYVSTPNATSIKNLLYALSYRKKDKQKQLIKEIRNETLGTGTHIEHIYNWDFQTLVRLLDRCGFDVVEHTFARSGPIVIPLFGKKIQIIKGNSKILDRWGPLKTTLIMKARKRKSS